MPVSKLYEDGFLSKHTTAPRPDNSEATHLKANTQEGRDNEIGIQRKQNIDMRKSSDKLNAKAAALRDEFTLASRNEDRREHENDNTRDTAKLEEGAVREDDKNGGTLVIEVFVVVFDPSEGDFIYTVHYH